jgi:hypothetical protein
VPPFDAGGFRAAGAVPATPYDLLAFLEAHLHTITWFRHPADGGPMYFHAGANLGRQAFLGFRPDTGTALAAVCTRRFRARAPFVATAYALPAEDQPGPPGADGTCRAGAGQP